ncbi:DUF3488 and DUF4129 domain-containing transglutaminase family protein [Aeromicrobium sp. CTD01-1L150]|uniref:transglutaminase TgpA family protein n=1 Tax=Aeromicrobium sp. CTD01-1L150 TaxID=3341830 RepID=UPI0035BF65CD
MLRPERRARPVRALDEGASAWVEHAAVVVALAALLLGFTSVVEGRGWFLTVGLVAGLVALVSAAARSLGLRGVTPIGMVVGLLAVVWIFVPQTLAAGVVPTASSFVALAEQLGRARVLIMEEAAPAPAARPIVLVLTIAFALLVVVAGMLLRRRRGDLLLGVLLVVVFVVPPLVSGRPPAAVTFVVPAAAWLVVLWSRAADRGPRSALVPATALGACGLVVAVVLPPALPDVSGVPRDWGAPAPRVFGDGINPMLQLGKNLRRGSTRVAATYTTTLDGPPYLRAAVLRDFDGQTWRPVGPRAVGRGEGNLAMGESIETESAQTTITIDELRSTMLPTPYPATGVSGLSEAWRWNRVGQTLVSESAESEEDQQYTVTSLDVQPTAEQMRALGEPFRAGMRDYLRLPDDVPEVVARTAREVVSGTDNDYDRALALQEHFQTRYQYSESAPVAGDYDGNGVQVLERFLEERAGYCVHFASGMAVMARELDIPARVVVGYAPGRAVGFEDGDQVFEVTSDDLHAWPELYFEGVGWVGFEPTPSVGEPTAFTEPRTATSAPEGVGSEGRDEGSRAMDRQRDEEPVITDDPPSGARSTLVVAGLLLVAGLLPGTIRILLRRRRLAAAGPEPWWREVQATAVDHGLLVRASQTPRTFAAELVVDGGIDEAALAALLEDVETSRYGRPGTRTIEDVTAARTVVAGLARRGGRRERLRARWVPRSLVTRR